jgi:uncharacterized protein with LGFP repeats
MSAIDDRYAELGGSAGVLGAPVTEETYADGRRVRFRVFDHGAIYWFLRTAPTEIYEVHGAIWALYQSLGGPDSFLEFPTSDETGCRDGVGRFSHFVGGSIYWTPDTGAHEVHGAIHDKWRSLGFEQSPVGYPTTDESPCPDGVGRFNHFTGGSIYWTPQAGAHEVHGAIHQKWSELGWETSFLGYPTTDETPDSYGTGRFNDFQGGSVYWSAQSGAHEVHGAIRDEWKSLGAERSDLGYPTSDETWSVDAARNQDIRWNKFEHGEIDWTEASGAVPWPNTYTFTVTGMKVMNTRSRHEDTDRTSVSVAVGNGPAETQTKDLGDVNNGDYEIGLTVGPVTVENRDVGIAFNYLILNAGNASWDDVNKKLKDAGGTLAQAGAKAATEAVGTAVGATVGTAVMPVIGSAIGAIAGWIAGEVVGLLTADCDGPVAVEQAAFKGQELWDETMQGPHVFSTIHDGVDSAAGCGSNSVYWVDWTLARA